jgi:hypothetical protein|tara:strand:- start:1701 stop:2024 length:324 start_codon:yes stop_codon:yes gene_type:complete
MASSEQGLYVAKKAIRIYDIYFLRPDFNFTVDADEIVFNAPGKYAHLPARFGAPRTELYEVKLRCTGQVSATDGLHEPNVANDPGSSRRWLLGVELTVRKLLYALLK